MVLQSTLYLYSRVLIASEIHLLLTCSQLACYKCSWESHTFASLKCLSDRQFRLFTFVVIKHFTEKVNPHGWELRNLRKPELDLLI